MKNKRISRRELYPYFISFLSLVLAIWSFFCPNKDRSDVLIVSLISFAFGIPLLLSMDFSELNIFGFQIKLFEKVKAIEKRQLSNQVVVTKNGGRFWMDEFGDAFKIPDEDTAIFLAREKGIIKGESIEFDTKGELPSFGKTALPKSNADIDVFILYNNKLYYQSSLSSLYKLAQLNKINFEGKTFKDWEINGEKWVVQLNSDDFSAVYV